tara:strand:+ start:70 stop:333 length:264 start_codon:yes stop_codon:yes gene_type:complete
MEEKSIINKKTQENKKKSKPKCNYKDCKKKLTIVEINMGLCRCNKNFCIKHRLPEKHSCSFNYIIDKDTFIKDNLCINPKVVSLTTS